jgi:hypothetical protein
MKAYMADAFAEAHILQVKEFHLWLQNLNATGCPYLPLPQIINLQLKRDQPLMSHTLVYGA